jgi:hypothetical protein
MQKTLQHNVEVLQNQTIFSESFKNVEIVITTNYKLLYKYFQVACIYHLISVKFSINVRYVSK